MIFTKLAITVHIAIYKKNYGLKKFDYVATFY